MIQHRSLRHIGGWLALFAIWMQIALSFGHIHPEEVFGRLAAGKATAAQAVGIERKSPENPTPADRSTAEDACAICANMALAAALVLPDPIKLPLPARSEAPGVSLERPFALVPAPFLLFRTRAPPIV